MSLDHLNILQQSLRAEKPAILKKFYRPRTYFNARKSLLLNLLFIIL